MFHDHLRDDQKGNQIEKSVLFSLKFKKGQRELRDSEPTIAFEFASEDSLQSLDLYYNPQRKDNFRCTFFNHFIHYLIQLVNKFLLLWKAGNKFNQLCIKRKVKLNLFFAFECTSLMLYTKSGQKIIGSFSKIQKMSLQIVR